ncbi:hypothetical protein AQUCO_00300127v1 [Aquilegia coerulea]|uniref:Uncharacterized protein n=1 Tax=Aquilegia coerulea TaxID=218851 RepID=A0A2G5EXF7_AQUCA|nr:hypothetical protein AQUCO_00300127v1 [Aquilegia coerulea]
MECRKQTPLMVISGDHRSVFKFFSFGVPLSFIFFLERTPNKISILHLLIQFYGVSRINHLFQWPYLYFLIWSDK